MEMTLPPGRHETIEKQDPVHEWRVARLARLGIPWPVGRGCRRPRRFAPDGGTSAAGLPSAARTPHPPLIWAGDKMNALPDSVPSRCRLLVPARQSKTLSMSRTRSGYRRSRYAR